MKRKALYLLLLLIVWTPWVLARQPQSNALLEVPTVKTHPSGKVAHHIGYTVSYNTNWRLPNWVAYELTAAELVGDLPRESRFTDDPAIVGEATTEDYVKSGYDRGHMAPAADMKWSEGAMHESFYMTNICPQIHGLNAGDWKDLEEHVRTMATKHDHIYVCCGPIVSSTQYTIGRYSDARVVIPDAFFKVLLRKKASGDWTAIGFEMYNVAGNYPLAAYALSIDSLESLTGLDFFYNLPDSIETVVERSYSLTDWDLTATMTRPSSQKKISPSVKSTSSATSTSSTRNSSSSSTSAETYHGHTVYIGPRGGRYYYNSKGKKVYI